MDMRIPRYRFCQQRFNAGLRGVEWKFTFDEWWKVWQDSGHWEKRGRGRDRFCMCRIGDQGPYAAGNVFIATNFENVMQQQYPDKKLPFGVRRRKSGRFYATRMIGGVQYYLGTFASAELAGRAYADLTGRTYEPFVMDAVTVRKAVSNRVLPRGVRSQKGKYYATKSVRGVSYHIGTFPTPELAQSAYQDFSA